MSHPGHIWTPDFQAGDYPLGFDFGTTHSVWCQYSYNLMRKGPEAINLPHNGSAFYPSLAVLTQDGRVLTGKSAYRKRLTAGNVLVRDIKRNICSSAILLTANASNTNLDMAIKVMEATLAEMLSVTHELHPPTITLTVPYYFGQNENARIQMALRSALNNLNINTEINLLPEPVAASLAYVFYHRPDDGVYNLLVYDIGGGTLDMTLVRVERNEDNIDFQILATDGNSQFGGNDIDELMYQYVLRKEGLDFSKLSPSQMQTNRMLLLDAVIDAKHDLSHEEKANIVCGGLEGLERNFLDLIFTRRELNELLEGHLGSERNLIKEFKNCLNSLLSKANLPKEALSSIIPIGGSTLLPLFRENLEEITGIKEKALSAEERKSYVGLGAAIHAAMISDSRGSTGFNPLGRSFSLSQLKARIPHSLFLKKFDGKLDLLINANSVAPAAVDKVYYPVKVKADGQLLDLSLVTLFQGVGESRKQGHDIGAIDFSPYEIYTHGRQLQSIPIKLKIKCNETLVTVDCEIPKGNKDKSDLEFTQTIYL